jgi:prephenate dehydrogenase
MALRRHKLARRVSGYARRPETHPLAIDQGAVDEVTSDLSNAVHDADLVVFCTPLGQMMSLTQQMLPFLKPGAWVSDVGSVKASVVRDLETVIQDAGAHFIGGHPMAGSEKNGVEHARADLFDQAVCILTPTNRSDSRALAGLEWMWQRLQCEVCLMDPATHDQLVARSSHLPHAVASALARYVLQPELQPGQSALCATGFRDTTRVASGSPEMWRDIALSNREALMPVLKEYIAELNHLHDSLADPDPKALELFYQQARSRRDSWINTSPNGIAGPDHT